jgi:hypothetical protein
MGLVITVFMTCLLGIGVMGAFAVTPANDVVAVTTNPSINSRVISVTLDGIPITVGDANPVLKDGRVLVPFRAVGEVVGAQVTWTPETQTVSGTRDGITMSLKIESNTAFIGSREVKLDVPAQVINGRTFVPLRFAAEAVGAYVQWDAAAWTVIIKSK